jgi:hypothetical protein
MSKDAVEQSRLLQAEAESARAAFRAVVKKMQGTLAKRPSASSEGPKGQNSAAAAPATRRAKRS